MKLIAETPEWLGTLLIGSIIAVIGYVAKLIIELFQRSAEKSQKNKSKLIGLRSLLNVTKVAFKIQNKHARTLVRTLTKKCASPEDNNHGYETIIKSFFKDLSDEEKELHQIIRGITIHALYPTNILILDWLKNDTFFKSKNNDLTIQLSLLESHLTLWIAKYESWIPDQPSHALIYMADEKDHGLGFPNQIDELLNKKTGVKSPVYNKVLVEAD